MAAHDDRSSLSPRFGDELVENDLSLAVQSAERFIENDDVELPQERLGKDDLLAVALGQIVPGHLRSGSHSQPNQ